MTATQLTRCPWAPDHDPLYAAYHDAEWGVPEYDSRALWEKLVLDGMQAGLAWITILRKRETIREAFDHFDPVKVAAYGDADMDRLLANPGIIRSGAKINAAIGGARIFLDMDERGEDFSEYLWSFTGGKPLQNDWQSMAEVPAKTPLSEAIAKDLKKRGFKFCGPVIVYAFMQAVGMVNDHLAACPRHPVVRKMGES
ncbi:DNA-3-methyladenine glycosylase I [Hyphobacterium indicum]|uniref:DNA-3-methyladenine glycosylase I n=1 Tax=Hyphobacterium indicum TaxID=2162714 RepID=UPI000D65CA7C|nr:DNA-3-methyladenine glycosylase I [Hyphobacterium indicum]